MENPEPLAMEEDRSHRTTSFFTAKTHDGVQRVTTFTESLTQYATPIDRHLPFSLVHIISLVQNFFIKISVVFLALSQVLDYIISIFSGRDISSSSDHSDHRKITPVPEESQSPVASQSSSSPHSSIGTINPDSTPPNSHAELAVENTGNANQSNQPPSKVSTLLQGTDFSKPTDQKHGAPVVQPPVHSDRPVALGDLGSARPKKDDGDVGGSDQRQEPLDQHGYPEHSTPLPSHSTPRPEDTKTPNSSSSGQNEESPETAGLLRHLAFSSLKRYLEEEKPELLAESIQFVIQALDLQPPGHHDRPKSLVLLADAILAGCMNDTTGEADPSEGIEVLREVLTLHPVGHPDRPTTIKQLAIALLMRYEKSRRDEDLSDCLELLGEVQSLEPDDGPGPSTSLNDLVSAVLTQCERGGGVFRWEMRVGVQGDEDDPSAGGRQSYRSSSLHDLASTIFGRREQGGGPPDLSDIIEVVRGASTSQPPSRSTNASTLPDRLQATLRWMDVAIEIDEKPELDAYRSAFTHLGSALAVDQSLQVRQTVLLSEDVPHRPAKGLPLEAALWALAGEGPKQAVELLEQGRNVLLASGGHFQIDLSDVRRQNPALADRFHQISRLLDSAMLMGQGISAGGLSPIHRYKQISADREGVITQIRRLRGCESFLLPVSYTTLQEAALDSPVIIILVDKHKSTAIVVTSDGEPHTVNLPDASEDALKKLHGDMEDALNNPTLAIHVMPSILSDLWTMLVQPIMQELKHTLHTPLGSRIWWYPTSWASFLPLHAAGSYKKGGLNAMDLYVSSYTPSLQALRQSRDRLNSSSIRTESTLVVSQAQSRLAGVDDEVGLVFKLVPDASLLSDEQKTKERVLNGLRNNSWVHLACRGVPHPSDPFQSYFALHDGPLSLQEIIGSDLPSGDFAYVSACHSAARGRILPDEDLTLPGGMQVAGFNSVVGTLWEMANEDAPIVAEEFYKGLAARSGEGRPFDCTKTAEALHDAVKHLREKNVPLFRWVNLVHYGI